MDEAQQQETPAPIFAIEKLYLKDMSLEVPNAPAIFINPEAPQVEIELQTRGDHVDGDAYEVVLTITVTAKNSEERTLFLVQVAQAGLFRIANFPPEDLDSVLGIACPNLLFPYVREAVSGMVTRAGFPPVVLSPINFEGVYAAQRQAQQENTGVTH